MHLLNIGCGKQKIEGFINLDCNKNLNPDVVHNLEETPLPFDTMSIDGGLASHILEHIRNLPELLQDIWRITKLGGAWEIRTPHYLSPDAWGDLTHVRSFSQQSFNNEFFKGWNVHEVSFEEVTKLLTHDVCTHIHAKIVRMPKYIQYVPDELIEYMKQQGKQISSDVVSVSDGMKEMEYMFQLMKEGKFQMEEGNDE